MATGRPAKKKREQRQKNGMSMLRLDYPGKQDDTEILNTKPGKYIQLWHGHPTFGDRLNQLYFGDNLEVLAKLVNDKSVRGRVKLVYIDPPYSTQTVFQSRKLDHAYEDALSGPEYVEFLRSRLILLRELMAKDGSIHLHLDEKMVFHMKVIMDEVFGAKHYQNCIVRKKCNPKNYTRKKYGNIIDYILFYSKSESYTWNRPLDQWTDQRAKKEYQYIEAETGRRYKKVPIHAPGVRNGETGKPWRGMMPPPGKHWQFTPARLDELDKKGEIYWSPNGNPRRKVYLDQSEGIQVQDVWLEYRDAHNQNIKITGYPTEKNPALLKRIIEASTNPGDIVLDCFSGSGTTLDVASQLGRRWIGVDSSPEAIKTTLRRFSHGMEIMGDFVSERNGKNGQEEQKNTTLSLFESVQVKQKKPKNSHTPTTDFEILADLSSTNEIQKIVAQWQKTTFSYPTPKSPVLDIKTATTYLYKNDPQLALIIDSVGTCTLQPKTNHFLAFLIFVLISLVVN